MAGNKTPFMGVAKKCDVTLFYFCFLLCKLRGAVFSKSPSGAPLIFQADRSSLGGYSKLFKRAQASCACLLVDPIIGVDMSSILLLVATLRLPDGWPAVTFVHSAILE